MKRIVLLFIYILFSPLVVFAINITTELPVTVNLTENGQALVEIGFSRNLIKNFDDEVESITGDVVPILFSGDSVLSGEPDGDVYVYWKIFSPFEVSAELAISEALKGKYGSIDWYVSLVETGDSISSGEYADSMSVIHPTTRYISIGSMKLDIGTESLETGDVVPGIYKGELKLNISIV